MTPPGEFTLEEARAALEGIRSDIERLREVQVTLRGVRAQLEALNRRHLNNGVVGEREAQVLRREQRRLGEQAQQLVAAVHASGAEIKSIDDGLIDFPTTIEGVPSYWCWRAGEPGIEWWHPRSTGFSGRRRVEDRS